MGIAVYVNCSRILKRKRSIDGMACHFIHFRKLQRRKADSEVESLRTIESKIGKASMFWDNAIAEETSQT